MSQRKKPPKIGSVITFKYQELSNNGHPRFPVYLRPRTDLTWADVLESAKTKTPKTSIQKVIPSTKLSKQHSVLFSVIPSRDTAGKKIVTSDDEDEDEKSGKSKSPPSTSATTTSADTRKPCQYGAKCYRTNPDHFKQFQHPPKTSTAASGSDVVKKESPSSTKAAASNGENKPKQVCAFGAQCFRKSAVHLAMYSHPAKNASEDEVDRAAQEEIIDTKELIEPEEPQSPTDDTNGFFVKDKNKGIVFDDDAEDEDMEDTTTMVTRSKKEWDTLQKTVREQDERLVKLQNTLKSMDTKTAVKRPSPCRDVDDDTEAKKSKKV
ncbi:unnamed protein product [Didymodactylos carnosus]|uniref:Aprataxin and PNK-like factor PBZ domain-containing protein n=1 Tax=Didymodactylos carnosus TaxID=1234261 RepID=A0A813UHX7_9BILA|nr:unnamed protein product [Didymodactylos carnosus]CAF1129536.1 unnamed protein product [Didymodactylos carnosus]CAF3610457.1 unnamed protein product [Didymodactylos carnosus]CAF3911196.1 unnamed protein product [Didymodactylos carnosus]